MSGDEAVMISYVCQREQPPEDRRKVWKICIINSVPSTHCNYGKDLPSIASLRLSVI
jgi:hypothetical protein